MAEINSINEDVRVVRWRMANEKLHFREELKIIPGWAYGLAVVLVVGMIILAPILRRHDQHPAPLPVVICALTFAGVLLAAVALMIGYVNRDAKRRGMNVALWTILVIVIPNMIGFIIYFIAREPLVFDCPQCGTKVSARYNFCPKCKYNLYPTCPECKHAIRPGDKFCPFCAHDFATDKAGPLNPARPGAPA